MYPDSSAINIDKAVNGWIVTIPTANDLDQKKEIGMAMLDKVGEVMKNLVKDPQDEILEKILRESEIEQEQPQESTQGERFSALEGVYVFADFGQVLQFLQKQVL